ncbi:hypothetical protein ACSQ8I_21235 [Marinovum sp. E06]|uniref:hypothetical protein n=1 Tax=Marinovum sp. E06 TaxID=3449225 RepID=UPI003EDBE0A8
MNLVESIKTLPIKAEQSVRRNSIRAITSCKAGKIVPLSCIPLLREDRVSRGRARINLEMMETPETLMTPINVTAYAHFVPFLAFDRFEGSLDRFNRAYEGVPDKEGGDVVEFFRAHPYDGASEFYNTLGIHQPDGKNINAAYVEAYNAVVNFRRKSRSTKLPERTELDTTLSEAFWKNPGMSMIVPDFDQAAIDGEVQLNFSDAKIPVTGLGIATAGAMSTVTANRQMRQSDLSTVDVARYYNNTNQGWITIDTQQVGTQWFPAIYAEMQERNVQLSLSNIEMAKQTAAFARMRKEYSGLEDDHIIDLLMNAIRVPDAQMAQPILLDRKSTIVGYSKRYATDSDNLDKSVTTGETFLDLSVRTPAMNTGGVIIITMEIVPEQLFERQEDHFLTTTSTDALPAFTRDYLDPEKVAVVQNRHVDVLHSDPDGTFGYAPLNYEWNRTIPNIGGKFVRPVDDAWKEDRARIWSVETTDPALTEDFYLVNDLHHKVFADNLADAFEVTTLGTFEIVGNTVFGKGLEEDTGDYSAIIEQVDTDRVEQE